MREVLQPTRRHCRLGSSIVVLRVVIAEDSMLVREGIRLVIERHEDLAVLAACSDLPELLAVVDAERPDVVVTDVRMPPTSSDEGIRGASRLRESHPAVGVVVLSQWAEPAYANALLDGGSAGRAYLLKDRVSEPDQLADAIRTVARGGSVIDPTVVDLLVAASVRGKASPLAALTKRELEVLDQVAQGKSNAAVGQALFLTERAVEKHINALFAKLGLGATPDINRRVKAVLMHLSEHGPAGG
jgi:DNA-binding NarL/FixJ family response regulator